VGEILTDALFVPVKDQAKRDQMRVASVLKKAGWVRKLVRDGDDVGRKWLRKEAV
jgi:hypothetical protein